MSVPARVAPSYPIDVLREQIAPEASDLELAHFAQVCHELDLSPWADQIVLIGRYDGRAQKVIHKHQITVAGRRALATRTGRPYRAEGPMWCGPRAEPDAPLVWQEVWDNDERDKGQPLHPPYCARVRIFMPEFAEPVANGTAKWSEFAQYDSNGKLIPTWRQMPSHMLGKVAESMALRRAFPEVDRAVAAEATYVPPAGDRAEVVEAQARNAIEGDDIVAELVEAVDQPLPRGVTGTTGGSARVSDAAGVPARDPVDSRGSGDPVGTGPSTGDQAAAHRAVAALDDEARERWLAEWRIDDFGSVWPADAVADALSRRES